MSAEDEVAGLPGGGPVATEARKVSSAETAAIREIADHYRTEADRCSEHCSAVNGSTQNLHATWSGSAGDQFAATTREFDRAGASTQTALRGAADDLDAIADVLDSAKAAMTRICEDLLTQARGIRRTDEGEDTDSTISSWCAAAADDARAVAAEAESAIAPLLRRLGGRSAEISPRFSELAGPDDDVIGFQPQPGEATTSTAAAGSEAGPVPPVGLDSGGDKQAGQGHVSGTRPGSEPAPAGGGGSGGGGGGTGGTGEGAAPTGGSGSGGGGLGPSGGPPSGPPPGDVEDWIREAIRILQEAGIPVTEEDIDEIWTIIQKESGGDPNAINLWDSNAAAGHPSKGLMQCIDSTFNEHKLPGHDDIWNPVDNIIAGVRYTFERYGGFEGHPGLQSMAAGGDYRGY